MSGPRRQPALLDIDRSVRSTGRLGAAVALSIAAHVLALGVFGHIQALPSPGAPEVMLVELAGDLGGVPPDAQPGAGGEPLGTRTEAIPDSQPPDAVEQPAPGPEIERPPDPGPGIEAEPTAALAALEGQVESLTIERAELVTRLATEQERAARLEQRLRDVEREREAELAAVRATYERLVEALHGEIADQQVALRDASDRLSVSIVDRVLFPSGHAALTPAGRRIMDKVSEVLVQAEDQRILVEGHTDDVPIGPGLRERFPSNWELSTARATEVVKYLAAHGVPGDSVTAAGRADTAPVASNQTEAGRRQNRRIEIILLPPEARSPAPAPPTNP